MFSWHPGAAVWANHILPSGFLFFVIFHEALGQMMFPFAH